MSDYPKQISYVDDEESMCELVKIAFERHETGKKIAVKSFSSGKDFLTSLDKWMPEIILLDLRMPEMSGPDVLQALRERDDYASVPVVFMTGETQLQMEENYERLGVVGVLHKPFDTKSLPDQVIEFWKSVQLEEEA